MKNFIKKYWLPLIIIIGMVPFMGKWGSGYFQYKKEIRAVEDSIKVLNGILSDQNEVISESLKREEEDSLKGVMFQDSITDLKELMKIKDRQHGIEIAKRDAIPTDTLYLQFKEWLRTVQF